MFNFIQNLIYSFWAYQEKSLTKRLRKKLRGNYKSKRKLGNSESLVLKSAAEKSKQKLENNVSIILKKYNNEPEKLLAFVKRSGTNVYKSSFAVKTLKLIGYEEGFISRTKGIKALYLSIIIPLLCGKKSIPAFDIEPMFVVSNNLDNFKIIQQFYKWYAMKLKMPGLDFEAQDNLQKFLSPVNDCKIGDLSIDEILNLKDAIARDVESIKFVVELAKSTAGSKNALKKMISGGASI